MHSFNINVKRLDPPVEILFGAFAISGSATTLSRESCGSRWCWQAPPRPPICPSHSTIPVAALWSRGRWSSTAHRVTAKTAFARPGKVASRHTICSWQWLGIECQQPRKYTCTRNESGNLICPLKRGKHFCNCLVAHQRHACFSYGTRQIEKKWKNQKTHPEWQKSAGAPLKVLVALVPMHDVYCTIKSTCGLVRNIVFTNANFATWSNTHTQWNAQHFDMQHTHSDMHNMSTCSTHAVTCIIYRHAAHTQWHA